MIAIVEMSRTKFIRSFLRVVPSRSKTEKNELNLIQIKVFSYIAHIKAINYLYIFLVLTNLRSEAPV